MTQRRLKNDKKRKASVTSAWTKNTSANCSHGKKEIENEELQRSTDLAKKQ